MPGPRKPNVSLQNFQAIAVVIGVFIGLPGLSLSILTLVDSKEQARAARTLAWVEDLETREFETTWRRVIEWCKQHPQGAICVAVMFECIAIVFTALAMVAGSLLRSQNAAFV